MKKQLSVEFKEFYDRSVIPFAKQVREDFALYFHKFQSGSYSVCRIAKYRVRDLFRRMKEAKHHLPSNAPLFPGEHSADEISEEERENFFSRWGGHLGSGTVWLGSKAWNMVEKLHPVWDWLEPKAKSVQKKCQALYKKWEPKARKQAEELKAKAIEEYERLAPQVKAKGQELAKKTRKEVEYYAPKVKSKIKEFIRRSKERIRKIKK